VDTGDFRLLSRRALDVLNAMPERHRFIRGMVSWIGFNQVPYRYDRDPRFAGETKYPLSRMLRLATDAVTSFSTKPLRLAMILGFIMAVLGLLLLIYVLVSLIFGEPISGWASQLAAIAILGSMQLFVLGVMGWYLGRLYEQSQGRPLFVIEEVRDGQPPPAAESASDAV
jgi:dolichol-phosphate mannosyltransferase